MIFLLLLILPMSPFYEANFSSLPMRSISVFSNPGGLGINRGAELYGIYRPDPDIVISGVSVANIGFGVHKIIDNATFYEAGIGYKLPGAFSLGYAYQFGDTSSHIFGMVSRVNKQLAFGYKTTITDKKHMIGGLSIRPFENYLTLSCDLEYEGIDDISIFYWGAMLMPTKGIKIHFRGDEDFNWQAGLELSMGKIKIAGEYSDTDEKFSAGLLLSAQTYETFIPKKDNMATFSLHGDYPEIERNRFFGIPLGAKQGYTKILSDLKELTTDNKTNVVVVKIKDCRLGCAQVEELYNILSYLKEANKKIVFFADNYPSTLLYSLACTGDEIILAPLGSVSIPGMAVRKPYIKGTLDKLGIETDVSHVGKYKSATEILQRTSMSENDQEQQNRLLDDIYFPTIDRIARARSKTSDEVEDIINNIGFFNSDAALEHGLVDTMVYEFELENYLREKYGYKTILDLARIVEQKVIKETWQRRLPEIALVIAEGSIVPGSGSSDIFNANLIGGEKYAELFEKLAEMDNIKAVILRINSGGGDAFASEEIAYAIQRCGEKKPVIVSMADVAGSGGYYIACLADKIYADHNTITGSIGVLSVNLVTRGLYEKIGITWDYVKRGQHSDAFWGLRHFTEEEMVIQEKEIAWWYDKFTKRVAQGRGLSQSEVDALGQGRIYSGYHAKELGLIDEVGGFLDALEYAKEVSGIGDEVEIRIFPRHSGFSLMNKEGILTGMMYLMPTYEIK